MTGEVTLRGRITPVGRSVYYRIGIHYASSHLMIVSAHRAQITNVIFPSGNHKDVEHDVARKVRNEMKFSFVSTLQEALTAAFNSGGLFQEK